MTRGKVDAHLFIENRGELAQIQSRSGNRASPIESYNRDKLSNHLQRKIYTIDSAPKRREIMKLCLRLAKQKLDRGIKVALDKLPRHSYSVPVERYAQSIEVRPRYTFPKDRDYDKSIRI
jgi:hypothetical protein